MAHIFISYAEEDGPLAAQIAEGLESRGLTAWYYQRDCQVPGQRWWRRVLQAIEECSIVVLLISPTSLESAQVDREVDWAIAAGKPLVCVRHNLTRAQVEAASRGADWLAVIGSAVDISTAEGIPKVQEKLAASLAEMIGAGPVSTTAQPPLKVEASATEVEEITLVLPEGHSWISPPTDDCPLGRPREYAEWVRKRGPVSMRNDRSQIELVWVPEGTFMMGSIHGNEDEKPVRRMKIEGFWIGRTPVTVREWERVIGSVPARYNDQGAHHPVVFVSWEEAHDFCRRTGLALPPEAYWEYAGRGCDGNIYPWGNNWNPAFCQCKENLHGHERTAPVGILTSNVSWCGVLDMAGNVWEWCRDWYRPQAERAPQQQGTGRRSLRGGGWGGGEFECRLSCRGHGAPNLRSNMIGFRVARPKAK
ncbi:MAG: SUMF1/EgtB/PvdO family nonheme iron enzyme [Candidatus Zipacnadales bacterium]